MRKVAISVLASGMLAGGVYLLFQQLSTTPTAWGKLILGAAMLVVVGAYLLWADIIAPIFARPRRQS